MNNLVSLKNAVRYSTKRKTATSVTLDAFISTENILQNRVGISPANKLPPGTGAMPAYEKENILLANIRPYLKKIWFANKSGGCSADVLVFEVLEGYYPKFIFYNMLKDDFFNHVMNGAKGTKMPRGDKAQILEYLIPKFDYPTQKRIAVVLSSLDAKIEINNRINNELEALAKMLYDYWFVQFDFPDTNGKPYKTSGGKMVWNEELKRKIPEGWHARMLGDLGNFKNGVNYDPSNPGEIACPIINVRNISASNYFLKNEDLDVIYLRPSDVKRYAVHNGSIIIARSGIPGATRLISDFEENTLYCGFAIHYELVDLNMKIPIFFYLKSIEQQIQNGSAGTILKNVNQGTLNALQMALPDDKDYFLKFNHLIQPMFSKINLIQKENQRLIELRDWLSPMLMNGQVKVKDAEMQVEELMIAAEPEVGYGKEKNTDIPENKKAFAKQVLAGKIISVFIDDSNFTHIKFQKLQYLAEHVAETDLNWNYYRQAAGPYDPVFMHTINKKLEGSKWFEERQYRFHPLAKASQIEGYYQGYFGSVQDKIGRLFKYFATAKEDQVEIVATLYAVWNNYLISKEHFTDEDIVATFFKWSDRKANYTKEQVTNCLGWMKEKNLVPVGWGKLIKEKK